MHLLWTVLLPVVISGALYLSLKQFAPKVAVGIAVSIAYLGTYIAVRPGLPNFPPKEYRDYIFYLGMFGLVWGAVEPLWHKNRMARWGLRSIVLLGFLFLLLRNRLKSWEPLEGVLWIVGLGLFFLIAWGLLERLTTLRNPVLPTPVLLIAFIIWIAVASVLAATQGSSSMAQLAGALAASIGIIMLLSWFLNVELTPFFTTAFIFLLGTLVVCATVFPNPGIPVYAGIVFALSPLLLLAVNTKPTLTGYVLRLAIFALPILIMAGLFVAQFLATYNQPSF
jgi:hypothetical protein